MTYTQADLEMADRHVAEAEAHIVDQERIITRLLAAGQSTVVAEELLAEFHHTLRQHREHRDRIAEDVAASASAKRNRPQSAKRTPQPRPRGASWEA